MTCTPCEERRRKMLDALLDARIAEAVKQAAIGVKEMVDILMLDRHNGPEPTKSENQNDERVHA